MADFNGVTLPDLPSDLGECKYAIISLLYGETYALMCTTALTYYNPSTGLIEIDPPYDVKMYMANVGDETWMFYTEGTETEKEEGVPLESYATLWTNFDIKNIETGEVVIPSSVKPLYYYNGVRLPQIPSDVLAEYPYVMLFNATADGVDNYQFELSKIKAYVKSGKISYSKNTTVYMISYTNDGKGESTGERIADIVYFPVDGAIGNGYIKLLWSNYDIPNGSADATEIYIKGTQSYSEEETASITLKTLCDLGDAIREASGDSTLRTPKEMIAKVKELSSGGGDLDALIDGSITEVVSNVESIACDTIFFQHPSLEKVDLPRLTTLAERQFSFSQKLKSAKLLSVKIISKYAFSNCINLEYFECCAEEMKNGALESCKLKTLIIRTTDKICSLSSVLYPYSPIANGTGYIYVPRALVDSYKTATNWTTFANQFRAIEDFSVDGTITGELDESKI